ncbi:MAG: type III pantothenate kinase [Candidatus Xenobiia bacterium LiM19]
MMRCPESCTGEGCVTLLAIDAGNTCLVIGITGNGEWEETFCIQNKDFNETSHILALLDAELRIRNIEREQITEVGISNVIPRFNRLLSEVTEEMFGLEPSFVSSERTAGIIIDVDDPAEVGPDLIAAAVAGYRKHGGPIVLVDMGTATTFSRVDSKGRFEGVAICPGLKLSAEALFRRVSYLPEVPLRFPERILGKNTVESLQSGMLYGHVAMIEGMVARLSLKYRDMAKVVACGGISHIIKDLCKAITFYEPYLVLDGIRMIFEKRD